MKITIFALLVAATITCAPRITVADVATDWATNCASCHAPDGSGGTHTGKQLGAKNLRDSEVQATLTDANAISIIQKGVVENGKERMKAYKGILSDEQINALVGYIRSLNK